MSSVFSIQGSKLLSLESGDKIYAKLMADAVLISNSDFLESCSMEGFLDDGESFSDFIASDSSSRCFCSGEGDDSVYFIQTCGHEFFFTMGGDIPTKFDEIPYIFDELSSDSMAMYLLSENSALSNGRLLNESEPEWIDKDFQFIDGDRPRFRLFLDGNPCAGIGVIDGVVDGIYVARDARRSGLATEIFERARRVLGTLSHSQTLTKEGEKFVKSFDSLDL